jgi:proline iminopeptidase
MQTNEGQVTVDDGVRLFVETSGTGNEALVVLNGFYLFPDFQYLADGRKVFGLDLRSRGRSDYVADLSKLHGGIEQDVRDIEAVRLHFGLDRIDLLGHSYAGLIPILYALKYPSRVRRILQIGSMAPNQQTSYPPQLSNVDDVLQTFLARLGALQTEKSSLSSREFCARFWELLRTLYVFHPDNADKLGHWKSCHLESELNLMPYWTQALMPSIQRLDFRAEELAKVEAPVLLIHGTKDRSAPYGAARDWATLLPNARLLTIHNAAHAPWIEAPESVLPEIKTFLDGTWPEAAEIIRPLSS